VEQPIIQKLPYILGLDLGIGSVGWSIVETESLTSVKPKRLYDAGVRIFHTAEVPKNGESLNVQRRAARSLRRRLRRKKQRQKALLRILCAQFSVQRVDILHITKPDPWSLRVKGLDYLLSDLEFSRAIYHIIKHRGFKSNRKDSVKDKKSEDGRMLSAVAANENADGDYRSFAERIVTESKRIDSPHYGRKRNTTDIYVNTPSRKSIEDELSLFCKLQKSYGNEKITEQFTSELLSILRTQNAFGTRDGILEKVGFCTLSIEEKRAPKHSIAFQEFQTWQALNNTRLLDTTANSERVLTQEEKNTLFSELEDKMTFIKARKVLSIPASTLFKGLRYSKNSIQEKQENPESKTFIQKKMYSNLKDAISSIDAHYWEQLSDNQELLEKVILELTLCTTNTELETYLAKLDIPTNVVKALTLIPSPSGFAHLSLKALRKLLPFLKSGDSYFDACIKSNFKESNEKKDVALPVVDDVMDIRNPVVLRAVTQCRKVLRALYGKYGAPLRIHLEMSRDLSRSHEERKRIEKEQENNGELKAREIKFLSEELGIENPSGTTRLKYRLWKEQGDICAYSGKQITKEMLFDDNQTQIDHALPFSRTLDDTYLNKVLVLTAENQKKRDKTPYEYLGGKQDSEQWQFFVKRVESWVMPEKKKLVLLRQNVPHSLKTSGDTLHFRERDMNDTRYISRLMREYLEMYMPFAGKERRRIIIFSGPITSYFRNHWGLSKDRSNHRHHAVDAVVLACIDSYMLEQVVSWAKNREMNNLYRLDFPTPWISFNQDVRYRLLEDRLADFWERPELAKHYSDVKEIDVIRPLFVSHAPSRNIGGRIHEDTFYSTRLLTEGKLSIKKRITDEKLLQLKNGLLSKQTKQIQTESANSYLLLKRSNAFVAAKNPPGSMIRIDVFFKEDKYYVIPVYRSDAYSNKLPMEIINTNKPKKLWTTIDSSYNFSLSVYPGDYLELINKNGEVISGYFVKAHSKSAAITLVNSTGENIQSGIGIQKMKSIKKYDIDPIGRKSLIKKEKRLQLNMRTNKSKK
jgi:CRISPR-associated endonuclease Csn1